MADTIFALSTVLGKSGIAVIRVSGAHSTEVARILGYDKQLKHKQATFCKIYTIDQQEVLDEVILLYFQAPHSFNGEEILEIHLHGSLAIIHDVLNELSKINFLRIAEPGEFTKIAFFNGKMDLVKAEGLADLLESETSMQRKIAQKQLNGELSDLYNNWRNQLIHILSQLEAFIDFPEDDIPIAAINTAKQQIQSMAYNIQAQLGRNDKGVEVMNGISIVISGLPNVGKSSLMNLIAQKDIAIVSDIAGTTRDVLQIKLNLGGFSVILSDTAGIRASSDTIEIEGIKRAKKAAHCADINVIIVNHSDEILLNMQYIQDNKVIWLLNKADLLNQQQIIEYQDDMRNILLSLNREDTILIISTINNARIEEFLSTLLNLIKDTYQEVVLTPVTTRIRQKKGLEQCLHFLNIVDFEDHIEIVAQNVRLASETIGTLTGRICVEEILDQVFSNFCIGK